MDNKLKHLEFIQNVITRMNTNSFLLKGWCITLISALFVLSAKDSNAMYILIAYIPLPVFWVLDAFYLSKERQYRALYNKVSSMPPDEITFSMNTKEFEKAKNTWHECILSNTLLLFYGTILLALIIVMLIVTKSYG